MAKHPVTGMEIEDGHGALPESQQVVQHLHYIEQTQGEEKADEMRKELGLPPVKEEREAASAAAAAGTGSAHELAVLNDRITALEVNASDYKALIDRVAKLEHDFAARPEAPTVEAITAPPPGVHDATEPFRASEPMPAPSWEQPQEFKQPMPATEPKPHGISQ